MTLETQQQTTEPAPAAPPLSPELEYLKSHGEDISEFLPKTADATPPAATGEGAPPNGEQPKTATGDDEQEPGEVVVGEDGRVRDAQGRFVPKGAYIRQRQRATTAETRASTAEKELAEMRERWARLEERMKLIKDGAAPEAGEKKPAAEEVPDPEKDIVGALKWVIGNFSKQGTEVKQQIEATQQQIAQRDMVQAYREDTARVVSQKPDYPEAYKHAVQTRARELIAFGITDQAQIAKIIREEEQEIVQQALANKRSPAEVIYDLARAKGYQAKAPETPATTQTQQTTQPPAKSAAQEMIETINRGLETGKTLTGVGSVASPGLTLEQFCAMDPDEIRVLQSTPQGRAQLRAIGAIA